jgi:hypothetical protein
MFNIILCLICLINTNSFAQQGSLKSDKQEKFTPNAISFKQKSICLTKEGKNCLDKIIKERKDGFYKNEKLLIYAVTNPSEYKKDRFISFKRYKVVLDYLKNEGGLVLNFIFMDKEIILPKEQKKHTGILYVTMVCE